MKPNFKLIKNDSPVETKPRCLMCGHDKHFGECKKTVRVGVFFKACGCTNHPSNGLKKAA